MGASEFIHFDWSRDLTGTYFIFTSILIGPRRSIWVCTYGYSDQNLSFDWTLSLQLSGFDVILLPQRSCELIDHSDDIVG